MADTDSKPSSLKSGDEWWETLSPLEKEALVLPLLEDRYSYGQIQAELGVSTRNRVITIAHRIKKQYPELVDTFNKSATSAQPTLRPATRGAHARQIKARVKRRSEDLARAKVPELQVIKTSPPPGRPRTRDEIIDANIHDMPPPSRGPFIDDPINKRDRAYGAALNAIIYKLIDAGVV